MTEGFKAIVSTILVQGKTHGHKLSASKTGIFKEGYRRDFGALCGRVPLVQVCYCSCQPRYKARFLLSSIFNILSSLNRLKKSINLCTLVPIQVQVIPDLSVFKSLPS